MQPDGAQPVQSPWRILIVTLVASALSNLDQSLFGYSVPALMVDLHMSLSAVGTMISASFAFAIVSAPALAALVPRMGAPAVLALCVAGSAVFVGAQAFATTPLLFGAVRIISFGISAAIIPISGAYLASHSPDRGRALLIAIQQCGYPLGWFIASLLVAPLMVAHGWRATFLIAFAIAPLAIAVYWLLPKSPRANVPAVPIGEAPVSPAFRELLTPGLRRLTITWGLAFFLYGGAIGGTSFYLPTFFQQARGYDMATATHVVGLSYGIGMIGYLGAALVSELWLSRIMTIVTWLMLAATGLLITIWIPTSVRQDTLAFAVTTIFFYGASSIMLTGLLEQFPAPLRATAASVAATSCISLGFVVFPVLTAAVSRFGWFWSLSIVIVPAVLLAGLLTLSLLRTRWAGYQAAIPAR
jgi:MFS transporter, putative metabolite:H+ symporter